MHYNQWWGFKPEGFKSIINLSVAEQVVQQVFYIEQVD